MVSLYDCYVGDRIFFQGSYYTVIDQSEGSTVVEDDFGDVYDFCSSIKVESV